jgi:hypothetical protein
MKPLNSQQTNSSLFRQLTQTVRHQQLSWYYQQGVVEVRLSALSYPARPPDSFGFQPLDGNM